MMGEYFDRPVPANQQATPGSSAPIRGGASSASNESVAKHPTMYQETPNIQWEKGPLQPEGRFFDASDRNLLCMDVLGDLCVVGSADHGLKVFDVKNGKEKRNLYNKKFGHTEWVTSCGFLSDGRIISGGMDSKLCLWHQSALRCDDLLGHTGSISQVEVNAHQLAISSSYDRSIKLWDLNRRACVSTLAGHANPVMSFSWCGPLLLSGDRKGTARVWDLETSACLGQSDAKHGQVGALGHLYSETMGHLSFVGDQGGALRVFDLRRTGMTPVFQEVLHPGGVVALAKGVPCSDMIVTAGADKRMLCLDVRMDLHPVHEWKEHKDFIYSMETLGPLVLSGDGQGWLLVHDVLSGECLYGLGASKAAVRAIHASPKMLVCAGDDGKASVYDF